MHSIRKWLYKPKKEDPSKLAMFYWADEDLTMVTTELDSFDGRTDPERCSILVTQLRICQDKVLSICNDIMDEAIPDMRANRDFRIKFPDDVLHENLAGQLWFGAECLAAGSNIVHRELESASLRPLAKALTRSLDNVRGLLREQALKNSQTYTEKVKEALRIFDRLFAEFELCYVSAMVPIKSAKEYHLQQEIIVLFSETLIRGLKMGLIEQEMVDDCDPSLMFTIPRLAIVWGLIVFTEGPFNIDQSPDNLSELFRPFYNLLSKIRDLLWTLTKKELATLEHMLCSQDEPKVEDTPDFPKDQLHGLCDFITEYYADHNYKYFVNEFLAYDLFVDKNSETTDKEHSNKNNESKVNKQSRTNEECPRAGSSNSSENDLKLLSNQPATSKSHGTPQRPRNLLKEFKNGRYSRNLLTTSNRNRNMLGTIRHPVFGSCIRPKFNNISTSSEYVNSFISNAHFPLHAHSLECDLNKNYPEFCHCNRCYNFAVSINHLSRDIRRTNSCVEISPSTEENKNLNHLLDVFTSNSSDKLSQSYPTCHEYLRSPCSTRSKYFVTSAFGKRRKISKEQTNTELKGTSSRPNSNWTPDSLKNMQFISGDSTESANNSPAKVSKYKPSHFIRNINSDAQQNHYSSCQSVSTTSSADWNSTSPDTSSYNSDCHDDEEIALALQAAEIASQNYVRSRFENSGELLHRLFVCISGVADQLQTNCASDLRNILKCVFDMNCSQSVNGNDITSNVANEFKQNVDSFDVENACEATDEGSEDSMSETKQDPSFNEDFLDDPRFYDLAHTFEQMEEGDIRDHSSIDSAEEAMPNNNNSLLILDVEDENSNIGNNFKVPPIWLPDEFSSQCMACEVPFTMIRRRHHCRNCGKLFCSRCSSNSIPLPRFGHLKPVRVCNPCYMSPLPNLLQDGQS